MLLTIHQPEHLPWLGFFHKAAQAEVMVLLDTVPYRHKYFQNRNRVRGHDGMVWMNVPVVRSGLQGQRLEEVLIDRSQVRWRERCWRTLVLNYRRAAFFERYAPFFEDTYQREWDRLVTLNIHVIRYLLAALDIPTRLQLASELGVAGHGPQLILDIALHMGAGAYLSGVSGIAGRGKEFEPMFAEHGVSVQYQQFRHPVYRQLHEPFLPCMSAVDLLFNYGPESRNVMNGVGVDTLETVFQ